MKKLITDRQDIIGKNYISVHIRRTDHINSAKINNRYTSDEDFINFIDKNLDFYLDKNIYIATDNITTYNYFEEKYKNRVKFKYHK